MWDSQEAGFNEMIHVLCPWSLETQVRDQWDMINEHIWRQLSFTQIYGFYWHMIFSYSNK